MSSWMTVMVIYGMFVVPSDLILNSELRYCQAHMQMYTMSWMQLSVKPLKSCGSSYKVTQYVVLILVKESRKDIIFMFEMEHPCSCAVIFLWELPKNSFSTSLSRSFCRKLSDGICIQHQYALDRRTEQYFHRFVNFLKIHLFCGLTTSCVFYASGLYWMWVKSKIFS